MPNAALRAQSFDPQGLRLNKLELYFKILIVSRFWTLVRIWMIIMHQNLMIFLDGDLVGLTCVGEAFTIWELMFIDFVRSTPSIINFTLPNQLKCENRPSLHIFWTIKKILITYLYNQYLFHITKAFSVNSLVEVPSYHFYGSDIIKIAFH